MRKLHRIPQKGMLAGVIAGFAEHVSVDVTLLRVIFVLFVLAAGFFPGVIGYIAAVIIMPVKHTVVHEATNDSASNAH